MKKFLSCLAWALLTASTSFGQNTWHVDASATPPGNGSVAQPFSDLQFALAQPTTVSGDTLLVEPGSYAGPIDFLGKNVTVQSTMGVFATVLEGNGQLVSVVNFISGEGPGAILDGFTIRGGFGSATGNPLMRTGGGVRCVNSSPTLIRLQIENNSARIGSGVSLVGSSSLISNCLFSWNDAGSGLSANLTTAIVQDCVFEFNGASDNEHGGGFSGRATVRDCVFRSNQARFGAGASSSGATFERCVFENNGMPVNGVSFEGGGIFGRGSGPSAQTTATNCVFTGNRSHAGGAVANALTGIVIVRDSVLIGNHADSGGASHNAQLIRCDVAHNTATHLGAGLYWGQAFSCRIFGNRVLAPLPGPSGTVNAGSGGGGYFTTFVDCDVFENVVEPVPLGVPSYGQASGGGGARLLATSSRFYRNRATIGGGAAGSDLTNCTLYDNVAEITGGSVVGFGIGAGATFNLYAKNIIARGGIPNDVGVYGTGAAVVTYSDVQGGYPGVGNFDADPLFFAPKSDEFHLKPGSPCIDAGDPSSPLDANGSRADVGAWPFDSSYCSAPGVWCASKPSSLGCTPAMSSSGTPSASGPDDFFVMATNFLGANFGLLAWSRTPSSVPFQGGTLCLTGPFFRAGLQFAAGTSGACDGTYSFHFSQSYRAALGINTYETIYAQWFARDALHPDGTGWSLSNAIEFTVCP